MCLQIAHNRKSLSGLHAKQVEMKIEKQKKKIENEKLMRLHVLMAFLTFLTL